MTYAETQNRAGIKVVKYDIAKKGAFDTWDGSQGLASLKGIRFAIINKNGDAVKNSAGKLVPDGGVMQVLTTDKNGYAATGVSDLPTGKYLVKELRKDATVSGTTLNEGTSTLANDTYMWADNSAEVVLTDSDKNSLKWAPAFYNSPVSAVPKFEKHDLELGVCGFSCCRGIASVCTCQDVVSFSGCIICNPEWNISKSFVRLSVLFSQAHVSSYDTVGEEY